MKWTFGIITGGGAVRSLNTIIDSIEALGIPSTDYEVIIVGGGQADVKRTNTRTIPFEDRDNRIALCAKKNLICKAAAFENLALVHDYVKFEADWYKGFEQYGEAWQLCVPRVHMIDGRRFRDYVLYLPHAIKVCPSFQHRAMLPYDFVNSPVTNKLMYVSGTVFCVKRDVALAHPLDEKLTWGESEDVEWCGRLAEHGILISCNPHSTVRFMKQKGQCDWEKVITKEQLATLEALKSKSTASLA